MLRSTEPAAQQPEAVKLPTASPPAGDSIIALYKEFLREKDEKIDTLNRRVWELEHENELIKELSAENARLKNRIEKLQSNVGEHYRIDDQMQPVPLVPQHINPPMREQNHPE
jgi:nuclear transport factor 2 (NTF2) superfamily protein